MNWFKKWFNESKKEIIEKELPNLKSRYFSESLPDLSKLNFKARRESLNLTVRKVGEMSKIPSSSIAQLESNKRVNYTYWLVMKLHNFYLQEESKLK